MTLYEVTTQDDEKHVRLVEAKTKAGALAFVARAALTVEKATPLRTHTLAARGVKIEQAKEESE